VSPWETQTNNTMHCHLRPRHPLGCQGSSRRTALVGPLDAKPPKAAREGLAITLRSVSPRWEIFKSANQLAGSGRRERIPIGVKVYTASPRWL
jgi:hypothetical protein